MAEQHRDHACQVEPLLTAGQTAADYQIVDIGWVELRYLRQCRRYDLPRKVVWPDGRERSLERAADRGTSGCDDYCLRHDWRLLADLEAVSPTR
jgi:hypothetical protein